MLTLIHLPNGAKFYMVLTPTLEFWSLCIVLLYWFLSIKFLWPKSYCLREQWIWQHWLNFNQMRTHPGACGSKLRMANELYSNEAGFQHEMNDCNKKALKHTFVIAISTALC